MSCTLGILEVSISQTGNKQLKIHRLTPVHLNVSRDEERMVSQPYCVQRRAELPTLFGETHLQCEHYEVT